MFDMFGNANLLWRCGKTQQPTGPRAFFKKFQQDDNGAVTVDFAVVTSLAVILGVGASQATLNGARAFAMDMAEAMGDIQPPPMDDAGNGNGNGNGGNGNGGNGNGNGGNGSGSGNSGNGNGNNGNGNGNGNNGNGGNGNNGRGNR